MSVAIVTGASGLIGSEAATSFADKGYDVVGIDNDMRATFFGEEASTRWQRDRVQHLLGNSYKHEDLDIRDRQPIESLFRRYGPSVTVVIHAASQPSHDWAARDPHTDFTINANGTLNLLEATRLHAPDASFVFTSTNKVYGDRPNRLPFVELESRWEIDPAHEYVGGIPEEMPIDMTLHSLFGASKLAADLLCQEYGRYFGMNTVCFRGGCLTGPNHSGAELHGFLGYLVKCCALGSPYTVLGYKGKQVRDNIHSSDLIAAFHCFVEAPRPAEVYNIGGGRESNCSMLEAIELCQEATGRQLDYTYSDQNRIGDHIWWISSLEKFKSHYPEWKINNDVPSMVKEMFDSNRDRWATER